MKVKENAQYMQLEQIKQFISKIEKKDKQIIFTKSKDVEYVTNGYSDMYLILDKNIKVTQVEFNGRCGLTINNDNSIRANVLLWDWEVKDGSVDVEGALNGVLVIKIGGHCIEITREVCDEILAIIPQENKGKGD